MVSLCCGTTTFNSIFSRIKDWLLQQKKSTRPQYLKIPFCYPSHRTKFKFLSIKNWMWISVIFRYFEVKIWILCVKFQTAYLLEVSFLFKFVIRQKRNYGQKMDFFPVCYSTLRKFSNIHTNYGRLLVIQRIKAKYGGKAAMKENRNAIHSWKLCKLLCHPDLT